MANQFNLDDMIAASNSNDDEFDASAIFRRNPVSGKIAAEAKAEITPQPVAHISTPKKESAWVPDQDVLSEVPDVGKSSGVTYEKSEVQLTENKQLKDIGDEIVSAGGAIEHTEMERIAINIREACFRNHILELHIPEVCPERLAMINVASGKETDKVREELDKIFAALLQDHPDWITQKIDDSNTAPTSTTTEGEGIINPGKPNTDGLEKLDRQYSPDDVKIIIDKSQVDQLDFTEDELAKIKKSHTIELNIKERGTINFSNIETAPEDAIDRILDTYKPQVNGLQTVLPASRYRCTVSGLSYPDLIELGADREINDQDSVRSIWSVIFKHVHNPSIGAFESYTTYTDSTGEVHRVKSNEEVPDDAINVHHVSEYEDFMNKTSYLDQGFLLWNILCLTASNNEIVSARCAKETCKNRIEFSYNPNDVLDKDSIQDAVSHEMEQTRLASSEQEIMDWYNGSFVRSKSVVELPDSKIKMQYGHASARTYVEDLYNDTQEAERLLTQIRNGEFSDRSMIGKLNMRLFLPAILSFIVPDPSDPEKLYRIDSTTGKLRVLDSLSFRDWAVVDEIAALVITPYNFKYRLKGPRCPKCGTVNTFDLGGVEGLLFLIDDLRTGTKVSLTT